MVVPALRALAKNRISASGNVALGEEAAHDGADLSGGADDAEADGVAHAFHGTGGALCDRRRAATGRGERASVRLGAPFRLERVPVDNLPVALAAPIE